MYSLRGVAEFGGGRTQNRKTNKEYDFRLSEKQRALLRRKPAHETGFRTDRLDRLDGLPVHLACGVNDKYIEIDQWLAGQLSPTPQTMWAIGS